MTYGYDDTDPFVDDTEAVSSSLFKAFHYGASRIGNFYDGLILVQLLLYYLIYSILLCVAK